MMYQGGGCWLLCGWFLMESFAAREQSKARTELGIVEVGLVLTSAFQFIVLAYAGCGDPRGC